MVICFSNCLVFLQFFLFIQLDTCRVESKTPIATCSGFELIRNGNEQKLKEIVATVGPVCVNIEATKENFMFYKQGIFVDNSCSDKKLNHGMLVVGYGSEEIDGEKIDYWIVKKCLIFYFINLNQFIYY